MNTSTRLSRVGNSKSLEMLARQPFHPPLQPPPRRLVGGRGDGGGGHKQTTMEVEEVEAVEEEEEMEEADYLLRRDPAYFPPHRRAPDTNKFLGSEPEAFTGIGRRLNPSSRNGNYTAESTQTMRPSKTSIKKQCCSSPTSKVI
jgi:hypothetical protein